jgi:hypothetical protein
VDFNTCRPAAREPEFVLPMLSGADLRQPETHRNKGAASSEYTLEVSPFLAPEWETISLRYKRFVSPKFNNLLFSLAYLIFL